MAPIAVRSRPSRLVTGLRGSPLVVLLPVEKRRGTCGAQSPCKELLLSRARGRTRPRVRHRPAGALAAGRKSTFHRPERARKRAAYKTMCQPPTAARSGPPPTTTTGEKRVDGPTRSTRFLHGLELFGKKWTKVADAVGSRTTVQVRSHAQKYFQKLEKIGRPSGAAERGPRRRGLPAPVRRPRWVR